MKKGFTLIEILMALGGVGVLVVGATSFLFSILGSKDQAVAESSVVEQVEVVEGLIGKTVRSARSLSVSDGGKRLATTGKNECMMFRWDEAEKVIKYGRTSGSGCAAPSVADQDLTSQKVVVESFSFEIVNPDESSRTVVVEMTVVGFRPLWSSRQDFKLSFVNLVDVMEGGE